MGTDVQELVSRTSACPSLTAKVAALLRAAHQLLEGGAIFADPLAVPIVLDLPLAKKILALAHEPGESGVNLAERVHGAYILGVAQMP